MIVKKISGLHNRTFVLDLNIGTIMKYPLILHKSGCVKSSPDYFQKTDNFQYPQFCL